MADTFKSLRISSGYTQSALAEKLGVTTPTISSWERGKSSPSPRNVPRLAKLFNVSSKEIFFLTNTKKLSKLE